MIVIYLRYNHLCLILDIPPMNDFYEISVPVTLPSRCGRARNLNVQRLRDY